MEKSLLCAYHPAGVHDINLSEKRGSRAPAPSIVDAKVPFRSDLCALDRVFYRGGPPEPSWDTEWFMN